MKELDPDFIEEKNKQAIKVIRLYTIHDYDGEDANLYFAEYSQNVTFDSIEYVAFPITFDSISEKSQGEVDEVRLIVSNVSRIIEAYLQQYILRKKKVTIKYVHADHLAENTVMYEEIFYIDNYETNNQQAIFTLSSRLDVLQVRLPLRTVTRTHCPWVFKGIECKYSGEETTCNRTLQRCRELSNTLNFGGFPSAGGKRMFS